MLLLMKLSYVDNVNVENRNSNKTFSRFDIDSFMFGTSFIHLLFKIINLKSKHTTFECMFKDSFHHKCLEFTDTVPC